MLELFKRQEKKEPLKEVLPTPKPGLLEKEDAALAEILKNLHELSEQLNTKIQQIDNRIKEVEIKQSKNPEVIELNGKIEKLEKTIGEFSSIYEVISQQYNPFVQKGETTQKEIATQQPTIQSETKNQELPTTHKQNSIQTITPLTPQSAPSSGSIITAAPTTSIAEERELRLQKNTAELAKVQTTKHITVEDALNKEQHPVPIGTLKVEENFDIEQAGTHKKIHEHLDIDTSKAKDIENALHKLVAQNDEWHDSVITAIFNEKQREGIDHSRVVEHKQRFFLKDHEPLCGVHDLAKILNTTRGDLIFSEHVTPSYDHFADWIEYALLYPDLAAKLRTVKDKQHYLLALLL